MCILILNSNLRLFEPRHARQVGESIGDLVNRARSAKRPIAHLHPGNTDRPHLLPVNIGRYEPVFRSFDFMDEIPAGLIDFVVSSHAKTISLVGAASWDHFGRLHRLFSAAGFLAKIEPGAVLPFHGGGNIDH